MFIVKSIKEGIMISHFKINFDIVPTLCNPINAIEEHTGPLFQKNSETNSYKIGREQELEGICDALPS